MELKKSEVKALQSMLRQRGWEVLKKIIANHKKESGLEMYAFDIESDEWRKLFKKQQAYINALDNVLDLASIHAQEVFEVEE